MRIHVYLLFSVKLLQYGNYERGNFLHFIGEKEGRREQDQNKRRFQQAASGRRVKTRKIKLSDLHRAGPFPAAGAHNDVPNPFSYIKGMNIRLHNAHLPSL